MPKFVIEREIPGASRMSEEELRAATLKSMEALQELGNEIQWIHSYVTDNKVYCIYYAPDDSLIRKHGSLAGVPVDRVSAVRRMLDPANFS